MRVVKTIVCLANSRKLSGFCVAGRELHKGEPGEWIRPVSNRKNEEISKHEQLYEDGSLPKLMDILDVPLLKPRRSNYQTENWLLDPNSRWKKLGSIAWSDLDGFTDPIEDLWSNNAPSTSLGKNDRMAVATANQMKNSLRLIALPSLTISVITQKEQSNKSRRRVQARFTYNHQPYRLWVTDPRYEQKYRKMNDGNYNIGQCYATISIGEPFEGYCYKLVAAIMKRPK